MMNDFKIALVSIVFLFTVSCSDDFNPYGNYEEKYSLYCVLDRNSSVQFLEIRKSIPGQEIVLADSINASVSGASVSVFSDDSVFVFNEYTKENYSQREGVFYYYAGNLFPQKGKGYKVEALINNSVVLSGELKSPDFIITKSRFYYINLETQETPPRLVFDLEWEGEGENTVFLPKVFFNYYKIVGGDTLLNKKEIPLHLVLTESGFGLSYPSFTNSRLQRFGFEGFEYVVDELTSEEEKSNILFKDFSVSLLIISEEYARYYNSINVVGDGVSIREIPAKFSNVTGGGGLFGYKETITQKLVSSYLNGLIAKAGFKIAK